VLADGGLRFEIVEKVENERFVMKALDNGTISSRKGLALPGKSIALPAITAADRERLEVGMKLGVDAVAISFVQTVKDVQDIKALLRSYGRDDLPVVAKLERQNAAVDNLEEIVEAADVIMVARGDLGVEVPLEEVPVIQKHIIKRANQMGKIVVTATQMLDSMMKNPRPTRAEATDVANAIYDGTTAIMLSGETAAGSYPEEAVKTMSIIAERAEKDIHYKQRMKQFDDDMTDITTAISHATCTVASDIQAKAIITVTISGFIMGILLILVIHSRMSLRFFERPIAVIVPRTVEISVASTATLTDTQTADIISEFSINC
jgi:pyruvate kinase